MKFERSVRPQEATRCDIQERIEMIDFRVLVAIESGNELDAAACTAASRVLQFILTIQQLNPRWTTDIDESTLDIAKKSGLISESEIEQVNMKLDEIELRRARYRRYGATPMSNMYRKH